MSHVPRTKDQLIETLEYMLAAVRADDSTEGQITYLQPTEGDEPCDFMVHAVFRIGNQMGQGSMIILERTRPALTFIAPGEVSGNG